MLDRRPLHRHWHGADPAQQGRHGACGCRRERVLGVHCHVRLHGRSLHQAERRPHEGFARLRQGPRRLRHRGGRRHACSGGARTREGARRPHLRRARRLRGQCGWLRRCGALGRGWRELHEAGHGHGEWNRRRQADRLHQHARDVHPGGGCAGARSRKASLRGEGLRPLRGLDKVPLWPRAGRCGCARGHLLPAHGRPRLPRRVRQHQ
mmetsp:Transcript_49590/g.155220  ORF Transcript_49590/g.155220 Transcript_49590/m.155220 type:complete len:208 (+) Transcript_49590:949-1572(+)